ncbi:MAG: hypothetical protein ABR524_12205, partial [Thermoanaerobaculia bacterium]
MLAARVFNWHRGGKRAAISGGPTLEIDAGRPVSLAVGVSRTQLRPADRHQRAGRVTISVVLRLVNPIGYRAPCGKGGVSASSARHDLA